MIKFSILIPSIPSRFTKLIKQFTMLSQQCEGKPVEILAFTDNKKRSIGYKRDALVQIAKGEFLSFVDDDDLVELYYVDEVLKAISEHPDSDLFTLKMTAAINGGNPFIVDYDLKYENEEAQQINGVWRDIKRKPFHNNIWRTTIAQSERFPDASYGEDYHWAKRLHPKVKTSFKIDKIMSHYFFDDKVTEAEHIFPEG